MTRAPRGTATILDVARLAGVSRTTVSRVLNEPDKVTADTLQRVREAATALDYAPNSVARGLRSGRTGMIALLVGDVAQPFHGALSQAVAARAEQDGMSVILCDLAHSEERFGDILIRLSRLGVDGIIIATADDISAGQSWEIVRKLRQDGIQIVTGVQDLDEDGVVTVRADIPRSLSMIWGAFRQRGLAQPTLVAGPENSALSRAFVDGAEGATVICAEFSYEGGYAAASRIPDDADSVAVVTIPMALGVIAALAEKGRRLPLIVCEEVPLAAQVSPPMTTCAVSAAALGDRMATTMAALIRDSEIDPSPLSPQLILRETFR